MFCFLERHFTWINVYWIKAIWTRRLQGVDKDFQFHKVFNNLMFMFTYYKRAFSIFVVVFNLI